MTRAGPARMLGLAHKGHLGPGADADVAIYAPDPDKRRMFALPRYVLKAGAIVLDGGEPREIPDGKTLHSAPNLTRGSFPISRGGSTATQRSSSRTSRWRSR